MNNILPFSGVNFFLIVFGFILFLFILKNISKINIPYNYVIFFFSMGYVFFALPYKTSIAIFFFLIYTYLIYYIFITNGYEEILFPIIVVAFPLILFKFNIGPMYRILGISYITFRVIQAISDSKNMGQMKFIDFASFLLFPTTLLAGPIDRSYRFQKDLDNGYKNLNLSNLIKGWDIFIQGVLYKFVLGDFVYRFWLSNIDVNSRMLSSIVNSAYAYSVYFFFDFAGYSAMAVGISIMIGINIPRNFHHPYLAQNPQEFWRRFHITLGSWLTDYFFKPIYKYLNGIKILKGRRLLIQNIAITSTFLLMGMWNGLKWYYIVSGFLFGIYSSIHNTYVTYIRKGGKDIFEFFPPVVSVNLKRFLMINAAVIALYFFSGRIPL